MKERTTEEAVDHNEEVSEECLDGTWVHKLGYIFTALGDTVLVTAWGNITCVDRAEARKWWNYANEYAAWLSRNKIVSTTSSTQHIGR